MGQRPFSGGEMGFEWLWPELFSSKLNNLNGPFMNGKFIQYDKKYGKHQQMDIPSGYLT